MSGFSAEWLALREPADAAARSTAVTTFVIERLANRQPMRIVDLGSGTGSNVRYLSRFLSTPADWRIVDHDPALLAAAAKRIPHRVDPRLADLRDLDPALLANRDLVTASALLDLVSEMWAKSFVDRCRAAGAAVLVALNYDGRIECTPRDEDDELVRDLVNRHQRTDKGFGPALGPDAGARVEALLSEAGYAVLRDRSDWMLGDGHADLQRQLIAGWADAAIELAPADAARIRQWQARREGYVDARRSTVLVGHDDVGAVL